MNLTININDITEPVLSQARKRIFIERYAVNIFDFFSNKRRVRKLNKSISESILMMEGFYSHLKKLDSEKAKQMLSEIKYSIKQLDEFNECLIDANYLESKDIKDNINYLLKSTYKAESILHRVAYKDKETLKTDKSIKDGIIKMNSDFIQSRLG